MLFVLVITSDYCNNNKLMNSKEFVQPYPLEMTPETIHAGDHSKYIPEAQDWSYMFGQRLHADLGGAELGTVHRPANDMNYWKWQGGVLNMENELMGIPGDDEARHHAINELNFHVLNGGMKGFWAPIQEGGWRSEGPRMHAINVAERFLALSGFVYFAAQSHADPTSLFNGKLKGLNDTMIGKIQEFDAVLALLGVVRKHPNWAVVPAPLNFERTKKRINVDFVLADCVERKAVGVQVKTKVRDRDYAQADKERVVFIDGTVDLDNVRAMRTQRKSSNKQVVAWPGMIAAKMVDTMKSKQNGVELNSFVKKLARMLVGGTKVDYSGVVDKIEARILEKL